MNKKSLIRILSIALALVFVMGAVFVATSNVFASVVSLKCDVNGDGIVNGKDLVRIFKHIKAPDVYPFNKAVDVNGDGVISREDVNAVYPFFTDEINIIQNGRSNYKIVFSESASDAVSSAVHTLINGIYELTGITLDTVYDTAAVSGGKYIIVGETILSDTADVRAVFNNASDTYAIAQSENGNIIIDANYDEMIIKAAEHYVSNLMAPFYNSSTKTLTFKGYYNQGKDILPDGFKIADLSKTKIVYATNLDGYRVVAEMLKNKIKSVYNVNVPVYSQDEQLPSGREILIGETDRKLSKSYYSDNGYIMEYDIVANNGSLQILCGGSFTARKAVEYMNSNLFTSANSNKVLGEGRYTYKKLLASSLTRPSGTDARIMTLNIMPYILGEAEYANVLPVRERAEIVAGMLISSSPDVVGLQEACYKWQEQLPHYMDVLNKHYGIGYKFVLSSYNGKNNYTPMIYRADKYDAIECKYQHYDYHTSAANKNGTYLRGAAQLVLQNKNNSSERFIVINSHWDHAGQLTSARPYQMNECASSEAAIVNAYKIKYPGVRIFCVGDFNSHRYNGIYLNQFCNDINGTVASDAARTAGTLKVAGGYHGSGSNMNEYGTRNDFTPVKDSFIDHIIFTSSSSSVKTSVLSHNTLYSTNGYFHIISDHCPVYADIEFTAG